MNNPNPFTVAESGKSDSPPRRWPLVLGVAGIILGISLLPIEEHAHAGQKKAATGQKKKKRARPVRKPTKEPGAACRRNNECKSGYCISRKCARPAKPTAGGAKSGNNDGQDQDQAPSGGQGTPVEPAAGPGGGSSGGSGTGPNKHANTPPDDGIDQSGLAPAPGQASGEAPAIEEDIACRDVQTPNKTIDYAVKAAAAKNVLTSANYGQGACNRYVLDVRVSRASTKQSHFRVSTAYPVNQPVILNEAACNAASHSYMVWKRENSSWRLIDIRSFVPKFGALIVPTGGAGGPVFMGDCKGTWPDPIGWPHGQLDTPSDGGTALYRIAVSLSFGQERRSRIHLWGFEQGGQSPTQAP